MKTTTQQAPSTNRGTGPLVVAYGGGVNTIALLIRLRQLNQTPTAIVMADPGDEWPETHEYRVKVANPFLDDIGFPRVTVVTLAQEAQYRKRAMKTIHGTLREECLKRRAIPSIAYGFKKCSQKYKARPSNWYIARQPWAIAAWSRGEKITRATGYDMDEERRALGAFMDPLEARRFQPYYPLINAKIDRDGCIELIESAGLSLPHKSACMFCPSNKLREWQELHDRHPAHFGRAVVMSENADIDSPESVGLMRCNRAGQRQLHLHVFQPSAPSESDYGEASREALPCDCAL